MIPFCRFIRFGGFAGAGFLNCLVKKEERKDGAAGFADGQRGCQAGFSEESVEKEHKRNIENKLPDKGMEERLLSFAHCLHAEGRMIIDELHRRGDTPDSEEQGRVSDGDQLADDRGNGHGYQCFRDRRGRKEFLLADSTFRI